MYRGLHFIAQSSFDPRETDLKIESQPRERESRERLSTSIRTMESLRALIKGCLPKGMEIFIPKRPKLKELNKLRNFEFKFSLVI